VPNEGELAKLASRLEKGRVSFVRVEEPDAPWGGALMALGLRPVSDRKEVRRYVSSLPLLR
jgi:hypothetical protein